MIDLGLSRTEEKQLLRLLASHHNIFIRVQLRRLNGNYVGDLSTRFIDGQVSIDADADVTRSLDLDLLDPNFTLKLDAEAPEDGALYMDRMIRIIYVIISPDRKKSFSVPVFTGPITKMERTGAVVSLECQGKEVLGMDPMWRPRTWKKGTPRTNVIRQLLRDVMGEDRIDVTERRPRLPRTLGTGRGNPAWKLAKRMASSMDYQLYYDGRGVARMRKYPTRTSAIFRSGRNGMVTTEPEIGFDSDDIVNAVEVKGAKKVRVRVVSKRNSPLSPHNLGRNGVPRFLPRRIEDNGIKTNREATRKGKEVLRRAETESVEVAFDTLPYPLAEEMDLARIHTDTFSARFRLRKFTIPLTADGQSSMGYIKNVKPNNRAIRRRRR